MIARTAQQSMENVSRVSANVTMDGKALLVNNKVSLECNGLVSVIMVNEINQTH